MPRTIGVLIFPDFQLLDAAGPITVFEAAGRETATPAYRLRVIARAGEAVTSSSGVRWTTEALSDEPLDTLMVAGGWGTRRASQCAETLAFVRACSRRA